MRPDMSRWLPIRPTFCGSFRELSARFDHSPIEGNAPCDTIPPEPRDPRGRIGPVARESGSASAWLAWPAMKHSAQSQNRRAIVFGGGFDTRERRRCLRDAKNPRRSDCSPVVAKGLRIRWFRMIARSALLVRRPNLVYSWRRNVVG